MQNNALTVKQRALIIELLSGLDQRAAARKLGVNISTVWRWSQHDAFKEAYQAAQAEMYEAALTRLKLATDRPFSSFLSIGYNKSSGCALQVV